MKFRFPTPYTVLMGVIVFAAIATWILPAGNYSTLEYNSVSDVFEISSQNGVETMPATEVNLEELNITIGLETFTSGDMRAPFLYREPMNKWRLLHKDLSQFLWRPLKECMP